jgi:hypothetical protein
MTRKEFDNLDSDGRFACPDCGCRGTKPYPNCGCPSRIGGYGTRHINKYHHNCEEAKHRAHLYLIYQAENYELDKIGVRVDWR